MIANIARSFLAPTQFKGGANVAIVMRMEIPGGTIEQYEQINDALGIEGDETAPDGLILHMAGLSEDGFLIVDAWESQEKLDAFFQSGGLGAALADANVPQVQPDIHQLHNIIPKGGGDHAGVIMEIEVEGDTDLYDDMLTKMPSHAGGDEAHPVHAHIAAVTDDGKMYIVDLWESAEAFAAFAEEEIAPAAEGRMGEVQPKFAPVHNVIRGTGSAA
jgi:heme-degrading monooxygenase HmoA